MTRQDTEPGVEQVDAGMSNMNISGQPAPQYGAPQSQYGAPQAPVGQPRTFPRILIKSQINFKTTLLTQSPLTTSEPGQFQTPQGPPQGGQYPPQGGQYPPPAGGQQHYPQQHHPQQAHSAAEYQAAPSASNQCSASFMRMTINAIPATQNLLTKSSIPLGCIIHPLRQNVKEEVCLLASPCFPLFSPLVSHEFTNPLGERKLTFPQSPLLNPLPVTLTPKKKEKVPVVSFGTSAIVRCRRCRTYINPFVAFTDSGRRWRCNICDAPNEVPSDYFACIIFYFKSIVRVLLEEFIISLLLELIGYYYFFHWGIVIIGVDIFFLGLLLCIL